MTRARPSTPERGSALVATFMLLLLLAAVGSAGMLYSVYDLKSSQSLNTGNQAFFAAEAGIQHALSTINDVGVVNFNSDVVQRWSTMYGAATKAIPNYANFTYTVTVAASATDPAGAGTITAVGNAPAQAQRTIQVSVRRGPPGAGYGAIHLASDTISTNFNGNSFLVDGNDHNTDGTLKAGGIQHPGISTRNDSVTSGVVGSLNGGQMDNIQGLGFSTSPLTPSVKTIGGPSVSDLNTMLNDVLAMPGVVSNSSGTFNDGTSTNPAADFGTVASPQITHLTNTDVKVTGNIVGAGILIADGGLDITGNIDFTGWIIVKGNTVIHTQTSSDGTTTTGSAIIKGSLWTADFDVEVGGSAILDFCQDCLNLAGSLGNGHAAPQPMQVSSWGEL